MSEKIDSPRFAEDRPADGPFTKAHFASLAEEWDKMRRLPDDAPAWNMDYFQWNGVQAALDLAAGKNPANT